MAGIVKSTKRRLIVNNRVKEVEVPTATLDSAQFIADLTTVGALKSQTLILAELNSFPTLIKNEATTALICGAYAEGKLYGMNGDTKSIEEFNFTRGSSGTRINAARQIELMPPNTPRIEYDSNTGQMKGYLLEPAATNLIPYSGMGQYGNFMPIYYLDRSRCSQVTEDGKSCMKVSSGSVLRLNSMDNLTEGTTYTLSFWIKASTPFSLRLQNYAGSSYNVVIYPATTSWQRIVKTYVLRAGTTYDIPHMYNDGGGDLPEIFIADIQLEVGSIATSYIPTTDAAATRLADIIRSTRQLDEFPNGTIFMNGSWTSCNENIRSTIFVSKSTSSRYWFETVPSKNIRVHNGASTAEVVGVEGAPNKVAVGFTPSRVAVSANGGNVGAIAPGYPNESLPLMIKGDYSSFCLRSLAIVGRAFSDDELKTVTA